jgi:hypothetical protein
MKQINRCFLITAPQKKNPHDYIITMCTILISFYLVVASTALAWTTNTIRSPHEVLMHVCSLFGLWFLLAIIIRAILSCLPTTTGDDPSDGASTNDRIPSRPQKDGGEDDPESLKAMRLASIVLSIFALKQIIYFISKPKP